MNGRTLLCTCGLLLGVALTAGAQSMPMLGISTQPAKVDGVIADGEYSLLTEAEGMKLGLAWTADALFVGLSAPTTGWVAVGLGGARMDGALIYIGYVTGNETRLKIQRGTAHRHADYETNAPAQYSMKEADGRTVLELALKPTGLITRGQKSLDIIVAMGGADSFVSFHKARASISVGLAR